MKSPGWLFSLALAAVLALAVAFLPSYPTQFLTQVLIFSIFAMSLDLLVGYTGLPSLGHSAYFGFAAYAAALVSLRLAAPFGIAAAAGLIAAVAVAGLFNLLALRTAKAYYLMITLALSQVLWSLALSWTEFTGGDNGLPGIQRPQFSSWLPCSLTDSAGFFYFLLIVFIVATFAMYRVVSSPFGLALKGIRENESRMRALGYPTWRYKFAVSLIAALFAGLAGELSMYMNNFVSPSALSVSLSAQVLLMILVGAAGTLFGSIVGAAVVVLLQYVISSYTERWLFIVGVIYVFIALYAPNGALVWLRDRLPNRARTRA